MPINSYVVSVDRDLSMLETVQLMLAEGYEELLIWDRVAVKWSFLFSLADAIRFTLFAVRSLLEHPTLSNSRLMQTSCTTRSTSWRRTTSSATESTTANPLPRRWSRSGSPLMACGASAWTSP